MSTVLGVTTSGYELECDLEVLEVCIVVGSESKMSLGTCPLWSFLERISVRRELITASSSEVSD